MTTRIFWLIYRHFFVLAPHFAQRVAHLADGRIGAHAVDQQRHGVLGPLRAGLQRIERAPDAIVVAAALEVGEPLQLRVAAESSM